MAAVHAIELDQLPDGTVKRVDVGPRSLAVVRCGEQVFAVLDRCPHKGAFLSDGMVSVGRGEIICPWHRFRFKLETGESVTNPELKVRVIETTIRDGGIYVEE